MVRPKEVIIKAPRWEESTRFACGRCSKQHFDKEFIDKCCICARCQKEDLLCSKKLCRQCGDEAAWSAAEEIEDTGGEIYCEENLYSNLEDFIDQYSDDEIPEYVHPAERVYHKVDMNSWLEHEEEEYMQGLECDAFNPFEKPYGLKELRAAVDAFNEANKENFSYFLPDKTKKICVRKSKAWENRDSEHKDNSGE